jgi:hypothetical protein
VGQNFQVQQQTGTMLGKHVMQAALTAGMAHRLIPAGL